VGDAILPARGDDAGAVLTGPPASRRALAAGLLFFLSGAAALVYQVAWQRILALHSGMALYSMAMIVAAFMAGLGIGSHLGGVVSSRLGRRTALGAFALVELGIGAFGACSPVLYYDWLYPVAAGLHGQSWSGGVLHILALLPPTLMMGASLPLLVRGMVREVRTAGTLVGYLYGINVLGASIGAVATSWLLIPRVGIRGAVLAAAAANLLVSVGGFVLASSETPAEWDSRFRSCSAPFTTTCERADEESERCRRRTSPAVSRAASS